MPEPTTWTETTLAPLAIKIAELRAGGVTEEDLRCALTILANSVGLRTERVTDESTK